VEVNLRSAQNSTGRGKGVGAVIAPSFLEGPLHSPKENSYLRGTPLSEILLTACNDWPGRWTGTAAPDLPSKKR